MTGPLTRHCQVCQARPKKPCVNTIRPGAPLPGRDVHIARTTNVTADEKESSKNDACY